MPKLSTVLLLIHDNGIYKTNTAILVTETSDMISELCTLNNELKELNFKISLLKESIKECILLRDDCIQRNKTNERKLQSLGNMKDQCEYLKDILLQENSKFSINAGKTSVLLSQKIKEFQRREEQTKLKYENLPAFLKLQELSEINEKLCCEYLNGNTRLESLKEEYWKVLRTVKSDFVNKLIKFSEEFSKSKTQA